MNTDGPSASGPVDPTTSQKRRILLVLLAGAVLATVVLAAATLPRLLWTVTGSPWPALPVGSPLLPWPVAGDSPANRELARRATAIWQAATSHEPPSGQPHRDVRPLLLQRHSPVGAVVILQAQTRTGQPRIAILTGVHHADGTTDDRLVLRADRPLPDPAHTRQLSIMTPKLGAQPGDLPRRIGQTLTMALADPDTDAIRLSSTVLTSRPSTTFDGRLAITLLPWQATAFTTTMTGYRAGQPLWKTFADDNAIGTRHAQPVTLANRIDHNTVTLNGPPATTAQLVTSRAGVVGQVLDSTGTTLTVALLNHPKFHATITAAHISRGRAGPTSTGLGITSMTGLSEPEPGETLLAYDTDMISLFPIARVTATPQPGDPNPLPVTPTADLTNPTELYIHTD